MRTVTLRTLRISALPLVVYPATLANWGCEGGPEDQSDERVYYVPGG